MNSRAVVIPAAPLPMTHTSQEMGPSASISLISSITDVRCELIAVVAQEGSLSLHACARRAKPWKSLRCSMSARPYRGPADVWLGSVCRRKCSPPGIANTVVEVRHGTISPEVRDDPTRTVVDTEHASPFATAKRGWQSCPIIASRFPEHLRRLRANSQPFAPESIRPLSPAKRRRPIEPVKTGSSRTDADAVREGTARVA